jgi:hypothetical protein
VGEEDGKMITIDLSKQQPSLADVLAIAKSEPVVIHSAPGEDYLVEPADEFDREAAALGSSATFMSFLAARSTEAGDISIEDARRRRGME